MTEKSTPVASTLRYSAFCHEDTVECCKLSDYYEGEQVKYVKLMLDGSFGDGYGKRRDWKARGIIPRMRNLTKAIVDKSAMAFNQPPKFETYYGTTLIENPTFDAIMTNADWLPFWQTVAAMTRLLKSVVVYNQKYIPVETVTTNQVYKYNPFNGESLKQMVTHHGNSEVVMDGSGRYIIEYAYLCDLDQENEDYADNMIGANKQPPKQYMVVTPSAIETWIWFDDEDIHIKTEVNPEGFVPAFFVHDSSKPMYDVWNTPGVDLGHANEIVNLHITDTEFAVAWQKNQTLFTNGTFSMPDSPATMVPAAMPGHTAPGAIYDQINNFQNNGQPQAGGLGSVIQVVSDDNSRDPFIKFDGPKSDLDKLHETVSEIIEDIANDWAVNVRITGRGTANSGFQLVVEEMDGLNLRARQIQYYQMAFHTMYDMLMKMYPELPMGQLIVNFPAPQLPVNEAERDANWVSKLNTGRGSVVDYFMEMENLTEEEAYERALKVKQYNTEFGVQVNTNTATPTTGNKTPAEGNAQASEQ